MLLSVDYSSCSSTSFLARVAHAFPSCWSTISDLGDFLFGRTSSCLNPARRAAEPTSPLAIVQPNHDRTPNNPDRTERARVTHHPAGLWPDRALPRSLARL